MLKKKILYIVKCFLYYCIIINFAEVTAVRFEYFSQSRESEERDSFILYKYTLCFNLLYLYFY